MTDGDAPLTAETVPTYVKEHLEYLPKELQSGEFEITAQAIQGGNVNYAFCVTFASDEAEKTIFVKQAPEYVAIFGPDGFPLSSSRMACEMDAYAEWRAIFDKEEPGKKCSYLPEIHHFDQKRMVVMMEFLDGYDLLDHVLVREDGNVHMKNPRVSRGLGDFMGKTHAATHSSKLDPERIAHLASHFENRPMRDVQLEFVFTKCYKEATDEQRAGLNVDGAFLQEIELLKKQYDGRAGTDNLVLSHGDLHPGSVMIDLAGSDVVKVIDPEFTVYGPPGLDVGSLLSGYVLAAIHQAYIGNTEAVDAICQGARQVWDAYVEALKAGGVGAAENDGLLREIEIQTVGFTVAEVCRTAMEFAGGRKWLQFEDSDKKDKAKHTALQLVDACMIPRHQGGIDLLLDQMSKVSHAV